MSLAHYLLQRIKDLILESTDDYKGAICPICGAFAMESFKTKRKADTPRLHIPVVIECLMYKCQNGHIFMSEKNLNNLINYTESLENKVSNGDKIKSGDKL